MRTVRPSPALSALLVAAALGCAVPAMAQQQTTITRISGVAAGSGTWGRTIIDTEPNGPNGGVIQSTYNINVPWTNGMTADQLAAAYRAQAQLVLPPAPNNLAGFGTVTENAVNPSIRVGRQSGVYTIGPDGPYPPGMTVSTFAPSNAEHAPVTSPAGIAGLMGSFTLLAWWMRRRGIVRA